VQYQAKQVVQALEAARVKVALLLQAVALKEVRVEVQVELLAQALAQVERQALALEQVVLRQAQGQALVEAEALVEVLEPGQVAGLVQVQLPEAE
jgi:hypothetical protein